MRAVVVDPHHVGRDSPARREAGDVADDVRSQEIDQVIRNGVLVGHAGQYPSTDERRAGSPDRQSHSRGGVLLSMSGDQTSRFAGLQEGALVIADISGYSKFVAQTEVDHSWSILHELLDTMVRSLAGRMDVSQVEGDAMLFSSVLSAAVVMESLQ